MVLNPSFNPCQSQVSWESRENNSDTGIMWKYCAITSQTFTKDQWNKNPWLWFGTEPVHQPRIALNKRNLSTCFNFLYQAEFHTRSLFQSLLAWSCQASQINKVLI